jgi:hypothetical protein
MPIEEILWAFFVWSLDFYHLSNVTNNGDDMTQELFNIMKEVITNYMAVLTLDECREYALKSGLTTRNSKLRKGDNYNVGLELLPDGLSGINLCPGAGACKLSCIAFTGTGNILTYKRLYEGGMPNALKAKCKRTKLFLEDRKFFMDVLDIELCASKRYADLKGATMAVRLNVSSDVDWTEFMESHPTIKFYSYTKVFNRKDLPNHHVTYSASENTSVATIKKFINKGKNVAMIFKKVPNEWNGIKVINGDETDNRYEDGHGIIIGLKFKRTMGVQDSNLPQVF